MVRAEVSNFRVEFGTLVKKMGVEDTEAYQNEIRTIFWILMAVLVIWPFAISVWARTW